MEFICLMGFILLPGTMVQAGPSINDTDTLMTDLLTNYNINIRPVTDQSQAVNVKVSLYIKSIKEFNDVLETFSFTGAVIKEWNDPRLVWNTADYNGIDTLVLTHDLIWFPEIILSSAATSKNTITQSWNKVRIYPNGDIYMLSANLIESTCAVDVKYYPFDTQNCEVAFFSLGYINTELTLTMDKNADFSLMKTNAVWDIVRGSRYLQVLTSGEMEIYFVVHLQRKSSYMVLNVLLPVLCLSLLNALVFLLIPESGERIGYCITTLLAIAVYMTIIADVLPQSSDPVPLISYKLVTDLVGSALIVFVTIINMRIQNKPEDQPVPNWLKSMFRCFYCAVCRQRTVSPSTLELVEKNIHVTQVCENKAKTCFNDDENESVTEGPSWKDISKMLDWIALVFFTSAALIGFTVFICLIYFG